MWNSHPEGRFISDGTSPEISTRELAASGTVLAGFLADGAVSLVARAVEADDPPTLPPDRFARDRFKAAIRRHVGRALDSR